MWGRQRYCYTTTLAFYKSLEILRKLTCVITCTSNWFISILMIVCLVVFERQVSNISVPFCFAMDLQWPVKPTCCSVWSATNYLLWRLSATKVWRYQSEATIEGQTIQWQTDKMTNNNLPNTTQKTKDRATRTPLNIGGELMCPGRVNRKRVILQAQGTHIHSVLGRFLYFYIRLKQVEDSPFRWFVPRCGEHRSYLYNPGFSRQVISIIWLILITFDIIYRVWRYMKTLISTIV